MWQTISYVSTASTSLNNSDMAELFEFVKLKNNNLQITGILLYADGNFFQVLEGEKNQIKNIFDKIKQDARHYNVIKIFDREKTTTSFTKYHSSFSVVSDPSNQRELQNFLDNEKTHNPENFKSISYLINNIIKTQ